MRKMLVPLATPGPVPLYGHARCPEVIRTAFLSQGISVDVSDTGAQCVHAVELKCPHGWSYWLRRTGSGLPRP